MSGDRVAEIHNRIDYWRGLRTSIDAETARLVSTDIPDLLNELAKAQAAVTTVRMLHQHAEAEDVCTTCCSDDPDTDFMQSWPCDTIAALNQEAS